MRYTTDRLLECGDSIEAAGVRGERIDNDDISRRVLGTEVGQCQPISKAQGISKLHRIGLASRSGKLELYLAASRFRQLKGRRNWKSEMHIQQWGVGNALACADSPNAERDVFRFAHQNPAKICCRVPRPRLNIGNQIGSSIYRVGTQGPEK